MANKKSNVYPRDIEENDPTKETLYTKYRKPAQNMCGLIKYPLSI